MIDVNAPFLIALFLFLFLLVIKWFEWYLFREGTFRFARRRAKHKENLDENQDKHASCLIRLKNTLFWGKADLKRPWYVGVPYGIYFFVSSLMSTCKVFDLFEYTIYLIITAVLIIILDHFIMLKANKQFFMVENRKQRYLRSQLAQLGIFLILMAIIIPGIYLYLSDQYSDPPATRDSVDWVIQPKYEAHWPQFTEGLAPVGMNGRMGFINKEGTTVIPFRYRDADNFYEGLAAVKFGGKWGYIDQKGREIIPLKYDEALGFSGGIAPVKIDKTWMVIDKKGKVLFKTDCQWIGQFHEGVAIVEVRDKKYKSNISQNLMDEKGQMLFSKSYELWGQYEEGCISVRDMETGRCYYLDRNEKMVIKQEYLEANEFMNGYAAVTLLSGERAIIDRQGNIAKIFNDDNDDENSRYFYQEGLGIVTEGDEGMDAYQPEKMRHGYTDRYGNVVIPPVFRGATYPSDGMIALQVDGLWGFTENPVPEAAWKTDPILWKQDRTQIGTIEGIPVYAGELERYAYDFKGGAGDPTDTMLYLKAFEKLKTEKAYEKYGRNLEPGKIQYQIGNTYYKAIILKKSAEI